MDHQVESLLTDIYDVVVVGGGPAGLGAAMASGFNGAKTLLIEKNGFPGGVATLGLGMQINQVIVEGKPRGGIPGKFVIKLSEYNNKRDVMSIGEYPYKIKPNISTGYIVCNPEYFIHAAFELLEKEKVKFLLHSQVSGCELKEKEIISISIQAKNGPIHIKGKNFIDCTGDGDVAYHAGADFKKRSEDGFLSPMTLLFTAGGIDFIQLGNYLNTDPFLKDALLKGKKLGYILPERLAPGIRTDKNIVYFNGSGNKGYAILDGTDVLDLTKAERLLRHQAIDVIDFLKSENIPGCKFAYLVQVAPQVAVRETRRIIGEYMLTDEDIFQGKNFFDVVARRYGELDIGFTALEPMATPHDVPYRCLLPKGLDNLLLAGRCISTSHIALSAGKSMGNCMATGEAAGTAAALAAKEGISPKMLEITNIQNHLIQQGVDLDLNRFT